jgi:uncharacterized protein with WD repeat
MKIKTAVSNYLHKYGHDEEKVNEFAEFLEMFFHDAPEEHHEMVSEFEDEIEDFVWEISDEELMAAIENLKRRDGTHSGIKWTHDETCLAAKQFGVEAKIKELKKGHFESLKFWFAMNYVYAVHYKSDKSLSCYVELAIDELTNKNVHFDDIIKSVFNDK